MKGVCKMTIQEMENRLAELKRELETATDIAPIINEMCRLSYEIGKRA